MYPNYPAAIAEAVTDTMTQALHQIYYPRSSFPPQSYGAQSYAMDGQYYAGVHSNQSLYLLISPISSPLLDGVKSEISRCCDWLG